MRLRLIDGRELTKLIVPDAGTVDAAGATRPRGGCPPAARHALNPPPAGQRSLFKLFLVELLQLKGFAYLHAFETMETDPRPQILYRRKHLATDRQLVLAQVQLPARVIIG